MLSRYLFKLVHIKQEEWTKEAVLLVYSEEKGIMSPVGGGALSPGETAQREVLRPSPSPPGSAETPSLALTPNQASALPAGALGWT